MKSFGMCPECVRVLPALCWRASQTVGLFSSARLCPLGLITGERLASYLHLAGSGAQARVWSSGEPVEWTERTETQ